MKPARKMAGICQPTSCAAGPTEAVRVYAGAHTDNPMMTAPKTPTVPCGRPLRLMPLTESRARVGGLAVAFSDIPGFLWGRNPGREGCRPDHLCVDAVYGVQGRYYPSPRRTAEFKHKSAHFPNQCEISPLISSRSTRIACRIAPLARFRSPQAS